MSNDTNFAFESDKEFLESARKRFNTEGVPKIRELLDKNGYVTANEMTDIVNEAFGFEFVHIDKHYGNMAGFTGDPFKIC